jgi:hypothetical protein
MRPAVIVAGASVLALTACSAAAAGRPADRHHPPHTVTVARNGRDRAVLDVASGAASVTVGVAPLGRELLRAATPPNSGAVPDLVDGHSTQVFLDQGNGHGPSALRIVLNSAVVWRLVFAGGASQVSLSIPAGVPAQLRLDGGASSVTLGGQSYHGVAGGTVLTMPGWAGAHRRYEITAPVGVSLISVTSR